MNYFIFRHRISLISALIFFSLFSMNIKVHADIPRLINYQGVLTDKQGNPVEDGSYVITFSLYDSPFEGSPFWVEVLPIITIKGYFNVMLGAQAVIRSFPQGGAWLGIKIGSDEEMALRTNLASVPYAFLVADSSVGTEQLKDKSITAEKIIPSFISSINGLSNNEGNIDIISGGNIKVTVDTVSNSILISGTDLSNSVNILAGNNITIEVDSVNNTLTISSSDISNAASILAGDNITIDVDSVNNTLTISSSNISNAASILAGDNITIDADSVNNTLTISSSATSGSVGRFLSADSFEVTNSDSSRIAIIGRNSDDAGSAEFLNRFGQTLILLSTEVSSPSKGALGIFENNDLAAGIFGKDGGGGLFQLVNASGVLTLNLDGEDLGGGSVSVLNGNGQTTVFLDGAFGDIAATGVKSFVAPHPTNSSKDIFYAAIEGPEAGMYTRGTAVLIDGETEVFLPEHFRLLASSGSLTVTVSPLSASSLGLAIIEKSTGSFIVKELSDGVGNYEFDYLVQAVRKGYEDFEVVRPKRIEKTLRKIK